MEGTLKAGAPIKARILDVSKKDGVVDLSLRPLHTAAGIKKAAKALATIEASSHHDAQTVSKVTKIVILHGGMSPSRSTFPILVADAAFLKRLVEMLSPERSQGPSSHGDEVVLEWLNIH